MTWTSTSRSRMRGTAATGITATKRSAGTIKMRNTRALGRNASFAVANKNPKCTHGLQRTSTTSRSWKILRHLSRPSAPAAAGVSFFQKVGTAWRKESTGASRVVPSFLRHRRAAQLGVVVSNSGLPWSGTALPQCGRKESNDGTGEAYDQTRRTQSDELRFRRSPRRSVACDPLHGWSLQEEATLLCCVPVRHRHLCRRGNRW